MVSAPVTTRGNDAPGKRLSASPPSCPDVVDVLGRPLDIGVDDLLGHEAERKRFDMRARRSVVGRADRMRLLQASALPPPSPFSSDDDLGARIHLPDRFAAAPAPPQPQHHWQHRSVHPNGFLRASLIAEPTVCELFDRQFFKKPSRSTRQPDAFIQITLDFKVAFGTAAFVAAFAPKHRSNRRRARRARRKAEYTGVDNYQILP